MKKDNLSLPLKLANCVAELRSNFGLTQTQLASLVGCSKNTISLIETGQQYPNLDLAFCIASVFCEHVDTVFYPCWSDCEE